MCIKVYDTGLQPLLKYFSPEWNRIKLIVAGKSISKVFLMYYLL